MRSEKIEFADGKTRRVSRLATPWSVKVDEEVRQDFSLPTRRIKVFGAVHGQNGVMAAFKASDGSLHIIRAEIICPNGTRLSETVAEAARHLHSNGNGNTNHGRRAVARSSPD